MQGLGQGDSSASGRAGGPERGRVRSAGQRTAPTPGQHVSRPPRACRRASTIPHGSMP
ncbi:Hypothetical protein AA314_00734 [Archangium gephyra]|uniref:Uncharacterized protein n=1 Tax=Archangium gephyra TaxID=48 RepID=A0AAC8Q1B2_9BACT|nr:Hypothetical protein AA314_00734 [Archangium gephyra]